MGKGLWIPEIRGTAYTLVVNGNDLYVGGHFTVAGDIAANYVAKWSNNTWSAVGSNIAGDVRSLAFVNNTLYGANGAYSIFNNATLYRFSGGLWQGIEDAASKSLYGANLLAASGDELYFASSPRCIRKLKGNTVSILGNGNGLSLDGSINTLLAKGTDLYAGGSFSYTGTLAVKLLSKWNGNGWSKLGSGITGTGVNTLAALGNDIYAGGLFVNAGDVNATDHVARWNGSSWAALGSGLNGSVFRLATLGNELLVIGGFSNSGNISLPGGLATWNGTTWKPFGDGTHRGGVFAVAVSGNNVYLGGQTSVVNSQGVNSGNGVIWWNGTRWALFGAPLNGQVTAIAVNGNDVYVGGQFVVSTGPNGANFQYILKWNGNAWVPLGSGLDSAVRSLLFNGNDLYVGGHFVTAGGLKANGIAKWNGSTWATLGSGVDGAVYALAIIGNDLYLGGDFRQAGEKPSSGIARYRLANLLVNGSAASYQREAFAPNQIVAAFGEKLATGTATARLPLPTTLNGTSVKIKDSLGREQPAALFFVSPGQVNYLLPANLASGKALVTVTAGDGNTAQNEIEIRAIAPGLFTANANGQGVPAAQVLRILPNGTQRYESLMQFDQTRNTFVATPIDLGATGERVFLILFGTGLRGRSALSAVTVNIGGVTAPVSYAGAQGDFAGLDQLNVELPRNLIGRGSVNVQLTVDGQPANPVQINVK